MQRACIGDKGHLKSILNLLVDTLMNWKTISPPETICMFRADGRTDLPLVLNRIERSPFFAIDGTTDFKWSSGLFGSAGIAP